MLNFQFVEFILSDFHRFKDFNFSRVFFKELSFFSVCFFRVSLREKRKKKEEEDADVYWLNKYSQTHLFHFIARRQSNNSHHHEL